MIRDCQKLRFLSRGVISGDLFWSLVTLILLPHLLQLTSLCRCRLPGLPSSVHSPVPQNVFTRQSSNSPPNSSGKGSSFKGLADKVPPPISTKPISEHNRQGTDGSSELKRKIALEDGRDPKHQKQFTSEEKKIDAEMHERLLEHTAVRELSQWIKVPRGMDKPKGHLFNKQMKARENCLVASARGAEGVPTPSPVILTDLSHRCDIFTHVPCFMVDSKTGYELRHRPENIEKPTSEKSRICVGQILDLQNRNNPNSLVTISAQQHSTRNLPTLDAQKMVDYTL